MVHGGASKRLCNQRMPKQPPRLWIYWISGKKYVLALAGMQNKQTDRQPTRLAGWLWGRRLAVSDMQSRQQEQIAAAWAKTTTRTTTTKTTTATTTTTTITWPWPRRQLSHNSDYWLVKRFSNIPMCTLSRSLSFRFSLEFRFSFL